MLEKRWTPPPLPLPTRAAAFGVFSVFVAVGAAQGLPARGMVGVLGVLVAVAGSAASLFGRQRWHLSCAVLAAAGVVALGTDEASNVAWFGLCVLVGWLILTAPLRVGASFWIACEVALGAEALFAVRDPGWAAWAAGTLFTAVGSLLGQHQRWLVAQLRDAQAGLAAEAQAEERNRIARELHDVIAHSLTISLLHVTSARLAVRDDPASAEAGLAEAERLGRQSLDEARHAMGLLRTGADPTTPLPGSTDLSELIDRFRRAGVVIDAELDPLGGSTAVLGLAVYRIVQEALTNATRHAPTAPVHVGVTLATDALTVDVDSAGPPGHDRGDGHGLFGIRERAAALGGTCTAGPGGTGWLVHAEFPLTARTS